MAKACAIIPRVVNKNNEKTESRLFRDLLSFLPNRQEAVRIYQITKNPEFDIKYRDILTYDDNNEPTIKSLIDKAGLNKQVNNATIIEKLNRQVGHYKKGTPDVNYIPDTRENRDKLYDKAIEFNENSDFRDQYVAVVTKESKEEDHDPYINISIEKKNRLNSQEAERMAYNKKLNDRILNLLSSKGLSVGELSKLEESLGINGVTEFDQAKTVTEGLIEIIRIAKGERGEKALPEEFAHTALRMLGLSNPLVSRLINLIASRNLAREIIGDAYDEYVERYNGDEVRLAEEAAGKLVAKHFLNSDPVPSKPYKTLLERVLASIKNFFRELRVSDFQKALRQVDKRAGALAREILDGSLDSEMKVENIDTEGLLYNLRERVARDKTLVRSIINNELKRLKIYEARTTNPNFSTNQQALISKLEQSLANNNEIEGIYSYIGSAVETLGQLRTRLHDVLTGSASLREKAKVLRDIRNYLYSYKDIAEDIRAALLDEEKFADNRYGDRVRVAINDLSTLLNDLFIEYDRVSMPLFIDFLRPFLGQGLKVPFGKNKGKLISVDTLVQRDESGRLKIVADKDISFFDRWLDSMADSSDTILKIFDQAVKTHKEKARMKTIEDMKTIMAAGVKLEQAGVKDTEWMFEHDKDGNVVDRYISEVDVQKFKEAQREMYKELEAKYGKNPQGEDRKKFKAERNAWYVANLEEVNGVRKPKMYDSNGKVLYANEAFLNLSDAKEDFYNTIKAMKEKGDSYLPTGYTTFTNAVKIRKDLIERIKSGGIETSGKQIFEAVKDLFLRRSDDTEYADRATVEDFEKREVQVLPIYYTKLREGEKAKDISTDVVSTMVSYMAMANDFNEMNQIIDVLELSRDMMRDNLEVAKTRGSKPLVEKFTAMGRKVESKVLKEDNRILARLNDFFEMQVYNRYMKDEGTFGDTKIDKAKVADLVNRLTSLNTLAFNLISGISNVATGTVMMRIESFAKEYFTEKDTIAADKIYTASMAQFLGELGNRVKTNKLSLFGEMFNVMQEYEQDVKEVNFDRKTWLSKMANSSAGYFINNAGEHWMQHRTALALANRYKMKYTDKNGNEKFVSLWDALKVQYIDPNNKKLGARLVIKEGYTKEDGTAFTQKDIYAFSRKAAAINQKMHGIYNRLDRSAFQRLAIGRMAIIFRKWMRPSYNRRFRNLKYNYDLQDWEEGYYNTTGRFLWQLAKELKQGKFALIANWKELEEKEKRNIIRAATETGHLLAVFALLTFVIGKWDDGDKDKSWMLRMFDLQARRLFTELGAMIPGPQIFKEGLKIVKSPAAGVNIIDDTLNMLKLLNPWNYETVAGEDALLKSGRFKGESRATKYFYEAPPIVRINKTIYRAIHPEESVPFYKQ